jgi:hypothetical protein
MTAHNGSRPGSEARRSPGDAAAGAGPSAPAPFQQLTDYERRRRRAMMVLGGVRCSWRDGADQCQMTDPRALKIDHINGDGAAHREELAAQGTTIESWVLANPDDARRRCRVLCSNHHDIHGHPGGAPSEPKQYEPPPLFAGEREQLMWEAEQLFKDYAVRAAEFRNLQDQIWANLKHLYALDGQAVFIDRLQATVNRLLRPLEEFRADLEATPADSVTVADLSSRARSFGRLFQKWSARHHG